MNLASALIKQIIIQQDTVTWNALRENYLPGEFKKLFKVIDKHLDTHLVLPSFEDLKLSIRDKALQEKVFAIESLEVDVDASFLLEYLKNEYAQVLILDALDDYIEDSIAMSSAEENIERLQELIAKVEENVDIEDPKESMQHIELFDSEEELAAFLPLGLNSELDAQKTFSREDYILVGGYRGSGKSITCANVAKNVMDQGKSSIYFTIEMRTRDILQRMCSISTEVPVSRLEKRELSKQEWNRVAEWWASRFQEGEELLPDFYESQDFDHFHSKLTKRPLVEKGRLDIIYEPNLTVAKIKTHLDALLPKGDYGVIVVDYLNKMKKPYSRNGRFDWTDQVEISTELKEDIAQKYKTMVFSAYQTDAEGGIRFAKGILDPCDAAWALNAWTHEDACISFEIEKMRNGNPLSFTSTMDWDTLRIGPETAISPKVKEKIREQIEEDENDL